jgi:GT2 family glycosyltransferase
MTTPGTAIRVAAVLTVHNRRETTGRCLARLDDAADAAGVSLARIIVDDGSTDGTYEFLDQVRRDGDVIVRGNGDLFWAGGMRKALAQLVNVEPFDHVLLLNDDAQLYEDALSTLLHTAAGRSDRLVVGRFVDPRSQEPTYGGYHRRSPWRPLTFVPQDASAPGSVDTMNANAVLVGRCAYDQLGSLDGRFTHSLADFDYGLRAVAAGLSVLLSEHPVGECPRNSPVGSWQDRTLSRRVRLSKMLSPKGLPPREWAAFCWRHGGVRGLPYLVSPWISVLRRPLTEGREHA